MVLIDEFEVVHNAVGLETTDGRVEVVLDRVLCSAAQFFGHKRPTGVELLEVLVDQVLFVIRPIPPLHFRIQNVNLLINPCPK